MENTQENKSVLRIKHAVVGGGLQLKPGQLVTYEQLGPYAEQLLRQGAVEPVNEPVTVRQVSMR